MEKILLSYLNHSYFKGIFDLRIGLIAIVCMIGPIITSLVKGRFWCGNLCPRGSFYDNIVLKFSRKKKVPALLKSAYFRTIITLLMLIMFTSGMVKNWGNLYGMRMVLYRLIEVTTLSLLVVYVPSKLI